MAEERSILDAIGRGPIAPYPIGYTDDKEQGSEASDIDRSQGNCAASQERLCDDGKQVKAWRSSDLGIPNSVLAIAVDLRLGNMEYLILDEKVMRIGLHLPLFSHDTYKVWQ
jgi:hypothetical protein